MLIIERRVGELIQIGDEIWVCVLDTDGETVRMGVSTPRDVTVSAVQDTPQAPALVDQQAPAKPGEDENAADSKQSE